MNITSSVVLGLDPVPPVAVGAGIVFAIIIIIAAIFLIRGGSKQKEGTTSSTNDWSGQSQGSSAGAWNQQPQAGANAWNNQQSSGAWGGQQMSATAQAPNSWGNQQSPASTPAANPWGNQTQQATPNPWGNQTQQATPNPWGNQQQQQPIANTWAANSQPSANSWDNQQQPPNANPWATQPSSGPGWGTQQAPNSWGAQTPSAATPEAWNQQQPSWGQSGASTPSPLQQGPSAFGGTAPAGQGWGAGGTSPASPSGNQGWSQQQPGGFGQQSNMSAGFAPPDNDKTVLRPAGAGAGSGVGYVRVEEGKEPGRVYEARKEALSIGRSRESDIFLEDLAVSRLHASIVNMGNGSYALKDEGSANGTKVNGQLVNKFQTYPLQEGDRIQLGQTVLIFGQR
jgi:hypothetical protein